MADLIMRDRRPNVFSIGFGAGVVALSGMFLLRGQNSLYGQIDETLGVMVGQGVLLKALRPFVTLRCAGRPRMLFCQRTLLAQPAVRDHCLSKS